MAIKIAVNMPFTSAVSKNRARQICRDGKPRLTKEAKKWLGDLKLLVANQRQWVPGPLPEPHRLHIEAIRPRQPGRKLDAQNLVDFVCDAMAEALGIDDHTFAVSAEAGECDDVDTRGSIFIIFTAGT